MFLGFKKPRSAYVIYEWSTSERNEESTSMTSSTTSSPSILKILKLSWVYLVCIFVTFRCGSCHFDRASNVKFSVKFCMFD